MECRVVEYGIFETQAMQLIYKGDRLTLCRSRLIFTQNRGPASRHKFSDLLDDFWKLRLGQNYHHFPSSLLWQIFLHLDVAQGKGQDGLLEINFLLKFGEEDVIFVLALVTEAATADKEQIFKFE